MLFSMPINDASRPLYKLTDVEVTFSYFGKELALCCPTRVVSMPQPPVQDPFGAWTSIERGTHGGSEALVSLLRNADIWRLRSLLAHYGQPVYRLSDRQVLTSMSQLVLRGALDLFERVQGHTPAQTTMSVSSDPTVRLAAGATSLVPVQTFGPKAQGATPAQLRDARFREKTIDFPISDEPRHWIEIQLLGEDDMPVPGARYSIRLPDGTLVPGYLDVNGFARLDGLKQPGLCSVFFPDLDREAWQLLSSS